jgi:DNA-binding YbaB/EbfC family protein
VVKPGGQPNLQQLMKQAQKMQTHLATAQAELAETEVTGSAGGGLIEVTMTATGEIRAVKIDPKAVDPDDVETLEDLVLAAVHNAIDAGRALTEEKMGPISGGLGGMGLPGF